MTSTGLRPATLSSALLLALVAGSAAAASAQTPSLADVARKEQERRKSAPNAAKVYTKSDLPKTATPAADDAVLPPPVVGEARDASAQPSPAPAEEAGEKKDEGWWRKRMATAREELRRAEMFAEALQTRINSLARDFSSRDDPAQRRRIGAERAEALNEQARVKQEIEAWKKEIVDIEEEARKAGVPPGWLR